MAAPLGAAHLHVAVRELALSTSGSVLGGPSCLSNSCCTRPSSFNAWGSSAMPPGRFGFDCERCKNTNGTLIALSEAVKASHRAFGNSQKYNLGAVDASIQHVQ